MQTKAPIERDNISTLLDLEKNARQADSLQALLFLIVNQTRRLVPFDQGIYFSQNDHRKWPKVRAISNIAVVDRSTPQVHWLERIAKFESKKKGGLERHIVSPQELSQNDKSDWEAFSPANVLWIPLRAPQTGTAGILWLARTATWKESEFILLDHLAVTYGHAIQVHQLTGKFIRRLGSFFKRPFKLLLLCALVLSCFLKVTLSSVAPVAIVPIDPFVVTAPMNGVVKEIMVEANQRIVPGQPLVQLDDTEFRNSMDVAVEALEVSKAQLEKARRSSFVDPRNRDMIPELEAQVDLRKTELEYSRDRLALSILSSDKSGIAIVNQVDEWSGRPVDIGEKILQIADPEQIELELLIPVADAVLLDKGNRVRVFLHSSPLQPIEARITHSEYEASQVEEGILAYRVFAEFTDKKVQQRIGLRGTAKIYGSKVTLFFYLFRRPITAIRQWTGW